MSTPRRNWEVGKKAQRMCTDKVRFSDDYVARIRADELLTAGALTVKRIFTYRCPLCRGWHWTSSHTQGCKPVVAGDLYHERRA